MGGPECHYKLDYPTMAAAIDAAQHGARYHRSIKPLRAYKCPSCGLFHLTHNPPEKPRKDRNARTD